MSPNKLLRHCVALFLLARPAVAEEAAPPQVVPTAPSVLDHLPQTDRSRILQRQLDTFIFQVEADRAAALEKWCRTAFGDPVLCVGTKAAANTAPLAAPAGPPPLPTPAREPDPADRPAVAEITGFGGDLAAVLIYGNGRRLRVVPPRNGKPGSVLPNGEEVVGISPGEVLLKPKAGPAVSLLFPAPLPPADPSRLSNR